MDVKQTANLLAGRALRPALLAAALFPLASRAAITVYPAYDPRIERDRTYGVTVTQGGETRRLEIYNHCEKSILRDRTHGGDVNRRFCEFAFDGGPVRIDISVCEDVKSYSVFPARLRLKNGFRDGVISVWLERPERFGIRLNDSDKSILSVFADPPEDPAKIPAADAPGVLRFDGWTDPPGEDGVIVIDKPVKEVYIAPGAVLNSRVIVKSRGAWVHGRGMVLDPFSDIFRFDQNKNTKRSLFRVDASDVTVEDIKLVDSRTFSFNSYGRNIIFRNIKAMASMMCSDGMTCGGKNLLVDGAWLYVGDDTLSISSLHGALYRNVAIGTSCNAIAFQGSDDGVVLENIDVFRADEGLIKNWYNGALRRNVKWNEMNSGEAKKEPGPQDLKHQRISASFKNLSAVDCVLFASFFKGGNTGTLPKTFGFENVSAPFPTGRFWWKTIGETNGPVVNVMHDSSKWLDTENYALAFTNLWLGGRLVKSAGELRTVNPDRAKVSVASTLSVPAIPAAADRREPRWTCPFKRYTGGALQRDISLADPARGETRAPQPENGENLLAERPSTRSVWQRHPSWLLKFDATQIEDGKRIYRLTQCEKNAGMQCIATDAFLRHGNGTYRLSFEARARCARDVKLDAIALSNETGVQESFTVPADGEWHAFSADLETRFDLSVTDLFSLFLRVSAPCDELSFRDVSLVKAK